MMLTLFKSIYSLENLHIKHIKVCLVRFTLILVFMPILKQTALTLITFKVFLGVMTAPYNLPKGKFISNFKKAGEANLYNNSLCVKMCALKRITNFLKTVENDLRYFKIILL